MASYSVVSAKHATLSTTTQDTVTLTSAPHRVAVINRSGATALTVRGQFGAPPSDITNAQEDDTEYVPEGGFIEIQLAPAGTAGGSSYVKVKGNGNDYSVIGVE